MVSTSTVLVDDAGGVRSITLRRPPVNALTLAEYDALAAAFDTASGAARVVVLRAEGRVWSAGQDLGELTAVGGPEERASYLSRATLGVAAAARCPVPILAALDGPAVGAGALLVACSDIVLGTSAASLAFPEVRVGLRLGRALLTGRLPESVITHAFVTGLALTADRLYELGVLSELLSESDLARRTDTVVADLLAISDDSLQWLRRPTVREQRAKDYLAEVAAITTSDEV